MRFLRTISALTAAAMLAMTVPAYADPPTAAPVVSPINKDQPAPFSGILLSPSAAAMVIAAKDAAAASLKLAVQHQYEVDMAQMKFQLDQANTTCTGDKAVLQAQVDDGKKQVNILTTQLKKSTGSLSAPAWMGIGGATGVIVTLLTVFAVSRATK